MTQQDPRTAADKSSPGGDPWHAFGYLVSGVAVYGLLGWLVDRWLGTSFLVGVGIVLGAGFGVYLTWTRFTRSPAPAPHPPRATKRDASRDPNE